MRLFMKLSTTTLFSLTATLVIAVMTLTTPVLADGQYGQYGGGADKPKEQPKEEVVHDTVDADLGDNLMMIAALLGGGAISFIILSKVTARVYLLD
jgi:hypothetical protein